MPAVLRSINIWIAFAVVVCVGGCGGRNFDVVRTATTSLNSGDDVSTLPFAKFAPLTLLDDVLLQQQGVDRAELTQVQMHAMSLTVVEPGSSQDLTFLSGVNVTIQATGLPSKLLATSTTFEPNENLGVLAVQSGDLLPYFSKADPQIFVTTQGQPAPQAMVLRAEITFSIRVSSDKILVE